MGLGVEVPPAIASSRSYRDAGKSLEPGHRPPVELYDLDAAPSESTNLAGRPETADVEPEPDARRWAQMRKTGHSLPQGPIAPPFYHAAHDADQAGH